MWVSCIVRAVEYAKSNRPPLKSCWTFLIRPELTVEQHLTFFCRLKGVRGAEIMRQVDDMIGSLKLEAKRHVRIKTLSGAYYQPRCTLHFARSVLPVH